MRNGDMSVLDWLDAQYKKFKLPTQSEIAEIMAHNTDEENKELWKKINEVGGYACLQE